MSVKTRKAPGNRPMPPRNLLEFEPVDWAAGPGMVVGGDTLPDRVARWCRARSVWREQVNGGLWPFGTLGFLYTNERMASWARAVDVGAAEWAGFGSQRGPVDAAEPPDDVRLPWGPR